MRGRGVRDLLVRFFLFVFLSNKSDLRSSCTLLPLFVLTEVAEAAAFGDGEGLGAVVPWRDLVPPQLGKSSSRPPYGGCFRPICAVQCGLFGSFETCLLLCGCMPEYAELTTRPTLDWVHISAVDSDSSMLLGLWLPDELGWPARWQSGSSSWLSSPTHRQCMRTSLMPIPSSDSPGYSDCFFLLGYVWIASSYITSPYAYKRNLKARDLCHLFLLVNCMQYHHHFCIVIMVVTTNSGEVAWKTQFDAFEASLVTYHMASMLVGEVEHKNQVLCCIWIRNGFEDASGEDVRAFPFGLFHRWRVRAPSLLVLRFNGRDKLLPSSVKHTTDLQLGSFQPQVHKPIRTLGEPPGYYRQAHDVRPSKTVVVVARRGSRLIRHQAPSTVLPRSPLEHLFELLLCRLQSLYYLTSLVEVPHLVFVL